MVGGVIRSDGGVGVMEKKKGLVKVMGLVLFDM